MAITAAMRTQVTQLYAALFNRAPDSDGLGYWCTQLDTGGQTLAQVAKAMYDTTPARTYYPLWYTNDQIAGQFYTNLLGRTADTDGLAYWSGQLNTKSLGEVLTNFLTAVVSYTSNPASSTNQLALDSQSLFNNKVTVGEYFAETLRSNDVTLANTVLNTVTKDVASVDTAKTAAATSVAAATATTFTLTTDADTGTAFTGGAGNDTYVGVVGGGTATNTLNSGDVLNGGSGTDTLSISASSTTSTTSAIVLSNIENISISNFETTSPATFDLSQATGVQKIAVSASASTGDTTITGLGNIVVAEMGNGSGDLTLTYTDAAVVGTADAQTLNLKGQTAGTFTVAGATTGSVETLNIATSVAASTVALSEAVTATIKTINVTGDQNLTLTEGANAADAVTTINAATFTGKLNITTSSANDLTITGGTANDTITISNTSFTSADSINGGSGTDTLSIANTAAMTAADFAGVTNVETVKLTGASAALSLASNLSATTFDLSDSGDQVLTLGVGYTNATTVKLTGDSTNADKILNSAANVALTVNANANDIDAATTITGGTGTDTLNLTAGTGVAGTADFTAVTAIDKVNVLAGAVAGDGFTLSVASYGTALNIDASAITDTTSVVTISGVSGKALTVTGGAGNDLITGSSGTGADNLSGGAGNDTFTLGGNLTSADTIDGGSGTDTLSVTSISATALAHVTNVENLALSGGGSSASLTSNLSFTNIDMDSVDNAAQTLTIGTGYTSALTVAVDSGDTVTNTANVALTVNAAGAGLASTTITGGTGTDTLNITADSTTVTFASLITNVDSITIVDGGDAVATAGKDISLTLGAYATALTINASALDAADTNATDTTAETLTVSGASVTKALTITVGNGGSTISGGVGNDVITGGSGVDSITSGAGNDSLSGGAGNDVFVFTGTQLDNNDTVAGGSGTDTISVDAGTIDVNYMNVSSVEKLTITTTGTTTLSTFANTAGITTITGLATAANTITASGMTSGLTINAATSIAVSDSLTGGLGNDSFVFTNNTTDSFSVGDTVIGGSGTDTLKIALGASHSNAAAATTNVSGIEAITITGTGTSALGTLTIADGTFSSVTGATINASGVTGTGTVSIDAHLELDSSLVITGLGATTTPGNETLVGGALNDTITGGSGADTITGGLGADVMTGGAGVNTFFYSGSGFETGTVSPSVVYYGGPVVAGTSVSTSGLDKITDFKANDVIVTNAGAAANLATNGVGVVWTETAGLLKGTYDSTAATFTFSTTGSDSLFVYDFDGLTSTNDLRAIVLVGYTDTGTADTGTTGLTGNA